jgi:hypothetical protein
MSIPQAKVDFTGKAPVVQVTIGDGLQGHYEIEVYPDSQIENKQKVAVVGSKDAAKPHSLKGVWGNLSSGWKVRLTGGIVAAGAATTFPLTVELVDGSTRTPFFVVPVPSADKTACIFLAAIELTS